MSEGEEQRASNRPPFPRRCGWEHIRRCIDKMAGSNAPALGPTLRVPGGGGGKISDASDIPIAFGTDLGLVSSVIAAACRVGVTKRKRASQSRRASPGSASANRSSRCSSARLRPEIRGRIEPTDFMSIPRGLSPIGVQIGCDDGKSAWKASSCTYIQHSVKIGVMAELARSFEPGKHLAAAMRPSIYLTGPITGVDLTHSDGWRRRLENEFGAVAAIFDPVREGAVHEPLYRSAGATARLSMRKFGEALAERNRAAIQTCDLLFANLKDATGISLGSVGEIFWADAFRKPILIVRDEFGNPHDHLLLNAVATWTFFTLEDSIAHLREFFALRS